MNKKIIKNKKGFSLVEIIVAVSIFTAMTMSALGIFRWVLEGQRRAIASHNLQENLRYIFELMSKEARMAKRDGVDGNPYCWSQTEEKVYYQHDGVLYFRNSDDDCVRYYIEDDTNGVSRLKIERNGESGFVTSDEININEIDFLVEDSDGHQPLVTMRIDIEAIGKDMAGQNMMMQTTISSRIYDQ